MTTVSAAVSVMPTPAALVPSRKTGVVAPSASKRPMAASRAPPLTSPSRRCSTKKNSMLRYGESGGATYGRNGCLGGEIECLAAADDQIEFFDILLELPMEMAR